MWISLLIVAYRRKHSDSQSEQAIPASGGRRPLSHENRQNQVEAYQMKGPMGTTKHIYTLHDAEVRQVGEERWAPFPASGGACF